MDYKITKKMLTDMLKTLKQRHAEPISLPAFGGDFWIIQCNPDNAQQVVEIMRNSKRPIPLLIKVTPC